MEPRRVAIVGLGVMGRAMARRLLRAGVHVTVYNRTPEGSEELIATGARAAASPAAAAAEADLVMAMVTDDAASRAVWDGPAGALANARPHALLVESSTLSPARVRGLASQAVSAGHDFIDAPVTGSADQAESGELVFLVGGDAAAVARATPVLRILGRSMVHLGPVGSGATMKLVANAVLGVQVAALAEAVALVERCGLDVAMAVDVLSSGSVGSPVVKAVAPRMVARDYEPRFATRLLIKDLRYVLEHAAVHHAELSLAQAASAVFAKVSQAESRDIAVVVESLRAGHEVAAEES